MDDDKPTAKKHTQKLDTLDDDGNFMQTRLRGTVHEKGFWHRHVHIWVLDMPNASVMMELRAASKQTFGGMWNCCTGHVLEGEPSLLNAQKAIEEDFKLSFPDDAFHFAFCCKDIAHTNGLTLKQMVDVYVLALEKPPRTAALAIDREEASGVKYVTIDDLEYIYAQKPADHVVVSNPEYNTRLLRVLRKIVADYHKLLPQEDSDDERQNKKAMQLLDTIDDDGEITEPGRRGEVHRQCVWHRAVHVWLLDLATGHVLLSQRSARKKNFGGQWNCSTGHVKQGDPCVQAAIKSIGDDLGLTQFEHDEFDFLFQARNVTYTRDGHAYRQVTDVFCVTVPSATSYRRAPPLDSLKLAVGEVDAVRYISLDELEEICLRGPAMTPDFVIPSNDDYHNRLFFYLRQRVRKHAASSACPAITAGTSVLETSPFAAGASN